MIEELGARTFRFSARLPRSTSGLLLLLIAALASGCDRQSDGVTATSDAGVSAPAASASAAIGAATTKEAAGEKPSAVGGKETWTGTYESAPGSLYIPRGAEVPNPKDWDPVKPSSDDAGIGRGSGTLNLSVDRATGLVEGATEGAIGEAIVFGRMDGDKFTATVARKDASDLGLTGTARGTASGASLKGTMKLAEANARVLRDVTFTLAKKP